MSDRETDRLAEIKHDLKVSGEDRSLSKDYLRRCCLDLIVEVERLREQWDKANAADTYFSNLYAQANFKLSKLRKQLKDYDEALGFYGELRNWREAYRADIDDYVPADSEGTSVIECDNGKRAREVREKYKD